MSKRSHALEIEMTDFVARHLWRFLRPVLRRHLLPRCKRCILTEAHGAFAAGLCPKCADGVGLGSKSHGPKAADIELLEHVLRDAEGSGGGDYDAIVLVSGGKDSAYLLHRLVVEWPHLRLLGVLVDNGFMSPFAVENATRVLESTNVPSLTIHPRPSFVNKIFRHTLTHLREQNGYSVVDLMDGHITFDHARNMAVALGIRVVLCGMGRVQMEQAFGPAAFEIPAERLAVRLGMNGAPPADHFDKEEMKFWFDPERYSPEQIPRFLLPLVVWNPTEEEILRYVRRSGLMSANRSRPLVTNNSLVPVIAMAELSQLGYCGWELEFARMVREGKSDRDYWLALFEMAEYSAKTGRFVNRTVEETLCRLGLTKQDVGIST